MIVHDAGGHAFASARVLEAFCKCQSGKKYAQCCAPYHDGEPAPTAEALMRSRYCAYALGRSDYVLSTWHSNYRPGTLELGDEEWRRLEILDVVDGEPGDATGVVEFRAIWREGGERYEMRERSNFVRESGRWFYTTGIVR